MVPQEGLTIKGTIASVHDCDTVTVEIKRKVTIRLLDHKNYKNKKFGCPELSTKAGQDARDYVEENFKGKEVILFVPAFKSEDFLDFNTFNRVLADVWLKDTGENLSEHLEMKGFALKNQKV